MATTDEIQLDEEQELKVPLDVLPTERTIEAVREFQKKVKQYVEPETRGLAQLEKRIDNFIHHMQLCNKYYDDFSTSVAFLNGFRQPMTEEAKERKTAKAFFATLSTRELQANCSFYNVDYGSFNDIDEIVDALVDAKVNSN